MRTQQLHRHSMDLVSPSNSCRRNNDAERLVLELITNSNWFVGSCPWEPVNETGGALEIHLR
jgi:hypothetical protein